MRRLSTVRLPPKPIWKHPTPPLPLPWEPKPYSFQARLVLKYRSSRKIKSCLPTNFTRNSSPNLGRREESTWMHRYHHPFWQTGYGYRRAPLRSVFHLSISDYCRFLWWTKGLVQYDDLVVTDRDNFTNPARIHLNTWRTSVAIMSLTNIRHFVSSIDSSLPYHFPTKAPSVSKRPFPGMRQISITHIYSIVHLFTSGWS